MFRKEFFFSLIFIILLFSAVTYLLAQDCKPDHLKISRSIDNYTAQYSYFNINNISTIIYNDGRSDNALTGNSGFEYPKGSGKTAIYQSGLLWGARVDNQIRAGGCRYRTGLKPGRILPGGISDYPNSESVRVYRVRPDYLTADLSAELANENTSIVAIRNQYEKDWKEWPAEWGAPYEDLDGNGIYNWEIDVPGVPGADQTLWFVANDFDSVQAKYVLGSPPMGIEMQVTIWGYNSHSPLDNAIFKKYKLIHKSNYTFEEMYTGMWTDHDIGDASNDFCGCDTTLNLMFGYNADVYDLQYGYNPPSVGFKLLQGPIVQGNQDNNAMFDGRRIFGKKNLQMTAFNHYI